MPSGWRYNAVKVNTERPTACPERRRMGRTSNVQLAPVPSSMFDVRCSMLGVRRLLPEDRHPCLSRPTAILAVVPHSAFYPISLTPQRLNIERPISTSAQFDVRCSVFDVGRWTFTSAG